MWNTVINTLFITRMYSSRVRTVRCSSRLSYHARAPHHAHPPPRMSSATHTHTHFTMHTLLQHACPQFAIHTSLLVNRITDSCKNITFPQLLLQMVITRPNLYSSMVDPGSPRKGGCQATVKQFFFKIYTTELLRFLKRIQMNVSNSLILKNYPCAVLLTVQSHRPI